MVQTFKLAFRRLPKNRKGTVAVIYALALLPIALLVGFAIDASRISSTQRHMQVAVDGAVLSAALEFAQNSTLPASERLGRATDAFDATYAADVDTALRGLTTISTSVAVFEEDGVQGMATGQLPLFFGGLFGRNEIDIEVSGVASASPARQVEIVLALDNTTSMFRNDRFNLMRAASKDFVNQLYDNGAGANLTSIGVVPWATLVNINSERPGDFDIGSAADRNPSAAGTRQVPNAPFQNRLRNLYEPEDTVNYTQESLERDFAPVAWRGCVRSAPNERIVSGGGTVRPLTDDPVPGMRWHAAWLEPELETINAPSGFAGDDSAAVIEASISLDPGRILRCDQRPARGAGNLYLDVDRACSNNGNSVRQVEACVSDPNEFDYFRRGGDACPWQPERDIFPWNRARQISGPNQNCPVAMLGLSQDRGQIIDKLDEMHPVTGGTHMDIGLMWGLRILSPQNQWAGFFGHDRPSEYDDAGTRKVLVLLTDGQNIAPRDFEGYYGCNEDGDNDRAAAGPCWQAPGVRNLSQDTLNALTADACTSIRDTYGIEIFTIAVDITDRESIELLAECAGQEDRAFNIRASEIDAVFESIAAQELRLIQ